MPYTVHLLCVLSAQYVYVGCRELACRQSAECQQDRQNRFTHGVGFRFKVKIRVLGVKGIRAFKLPEYLFARIGFGKAVCRLLFLFSDDLGLSVTVKR